MNDRYPHTPECWLLNPWPDGGKLSNKCTCGASREQYAFEAGKREGLEEAAKVAATTKLDWDADLPSEEEMTRYLPSFGSACELATRRKAAKRIRALKDTK